MPTVLVTGAARGIGRAIVEQLSGAGWDVFAGVRSGADAAAMNALPRVKAVLLDVTDSAHIAALDEALPERLDAVVNNAGIVVGGAMEALPLENFRHQMEVNVVGQLAVTQAVVPRLRASRGRIVFISSVNGRLATPMLGAYGASKFALEAMADSLRMELRPWGIRVCVVEPAQTDTDMWATAPQMAEDAEASMSAEQRVLYAKHIAGLKKMIPMSQRMTVPAERVAEVVETALTAKRPRARYLVGLATAAQLAVMGNMPASVRDVALRKAFGQP